MASARLATFRRLGRPIVEATPSEVDPLPREVHESGLYTGMRFWAERGEAGWETYYRRLLPVFHILGAVSRIRVPGKAPGWPAPQLRVKCGTKPKLRNSPLSAAQADVAAWLQLLTWCSRLLPFRTGSVYRWPPVYLYERFGRPLHERVRGDL